MAAQRASTPPLASPAAHLALLARSLQLLRARAHPPARASTSAAAGFSALAPLVPMRPFPPPQTPPAACRVPRAPLAAWVRLCVLPHAPRVPTPHPPHPASPARWASTAPLAQPRVYPAQQALLVRTAVRLSVQAAPRARMELDPYQAVPKFGRIALATTGPYLTAIQLWLLLTLQSAVFAPRVHSLPLGLLHARPALREVTALRARRRAPLALSRAQLGHLLPPPLLAALAAPAITASEAPRHAASVRAPRVIEVGGPLIMAALPVPIADNATPIRFITHILIRRLHAMRETSKSLLPACGH